MNEQDKLQTITFLPNGQIKKENKDARSLSTTGRLIAYRDQLKKIWIMEFILQKF